MNISRFLFAFFPLLLWSYVGSTSAGGVSAADDGKRVEAETKILQTFIDRIESGQIPDVYTLTVKKNVSNEEDAEKAFKEFLQKNEHSQINGKVLSTYNIRMFGDYYFTGIKEIEMPCFLFVKKGNKTVYLDGFNP